MIRNRWKTIGVSSQGFSHQSNDTPCQDCHAWSSSDGWLVAAVSDGAGSAFRSAEGAKAICEGAVTHISSKIRESTNDSGFQFDPETARAWISDSIAIVRADLSRMSASVSVFHATLIGVVANSAGGMFFHIGDGAGLATNVNDFNTSVLSHPANGEYANETYFFTQPDWEKHLRLTNFGPEFGLIVLMSDGVTPFALSPGATGPHVPFFAPLSRFLASEPVEQGQKAIATILEKDELRRITSDDKTLFWALRMNGND